MNLLTKAFVPALSALAAFGQAPHTRPEFEVASIRQSAPPGQGGQVNVGVHVDGAQFRCTYLSLKDYIRMAYKVKDFQIIGPDWMHSARFDISATIPAGVPADQVPEMMQVLLADRFQLKFHHVSKEIPVYGLIPAKGGVKMTESAIDEADRGKAMVDVKASGGRNGTTVNFGNGSYFLFGSDKIEGKKLAMANLAESLGRFVERPIVDMTELKGTYDFTLQFSPEDFRAMMIRAALSAGVVLPPQALQALEGSSGDSVLNAFQTVGLKLDPRKAPFQVMVIDQLEKLPTAN